MRSGTWDQSPARTLPRKPCLVFSRGTRESRDGVQPGTAPPAGTLRLSSVTGRLTPDKFLRGAGRRSLPLGRRRGDASMPRGHCRDRLGPCCATHAWIRPIDRNDGAFTLEQRNICRIATPSHGTRRGTSDPRANSRRTARNVSLSGCARFSFVVHLGPVENVIRLVAAGRGPVKQVGDQFDS